MPVSKYFQTEFDALPPNLQGRVRKALKCLEDDPSRPGPDADIKPLEATTPRKHRLRVGDHGIVYFVVGRTVKAIGIFHRGLGYRP